MSDLCVHQQQDNSREFMLYEQWRDEAALDAHVIHCQAVLAHRGLMGDSHWPSRVMRPHPHGALRSGRLRLGVDMTCIE